MSLLFFDGMILTIDSGATQHMVALHQWLNNYHPIYTRRLVYMGDNRSAPVAGLGDLQTSTSSRPKNSLWCSPRSRFGKECTVRSMPHRHGHFSSI